MHKSRLDLEMVERGLAESRSLAQKLVMAGQVSVNDQTALKASDMVVQRGLRSWLTSDRSTSPAAEKSWKLPWRHFS